METQGNPQQLDEGDNDVSNGCDGGGSDIDHNGNGTDWSEDLPASLADTPVQSVVSAVASTDTDEDFEPGRYKQKSLVSPADIGMSVLSTKLCIPFIDAIVGPGTLKCK